MVFPLPARRTLAAFSSGDKEKHSTRHSCRFPARFFRSLLFQTVPLFHLEIKKLRCCCRIPARFFCPLLFKPVVLYSLVKKNTVVQDMGFPLPSRRTLAAFLSGNKKIIRYCFRILARVFHPPLFEPMPLFSSGKK